MSFLGEIEEIDKTNGVRIYFDEIIANLKNSLNVVTQISSVKTDPRYTPNPLKESSGSLSSTHGSQRAGIPLTDSGS